MSYFVVRLYATFHTYIVTSLLCRESKVLELKAEQ